MGTLPETATTILNGLVRDPRIVSLQHALGIDIPLYIVGGSVRDALCGIHPQDIDCATRLHPDLIREKLSGAGIHVVPTGLKHQTVTAVPLEGQPGVEITTFRAASMSPTGGVRASETIEEDLRYRDFTINALAFNPHTLELIDVSGGKNDLERGIIRAVGVPEERFLEDPLRVIRMARFAAVLGFTIDPATLSAAHQRAKDNKVVSIERFRDELSRILTSAFPGVGLKLLAELGIYQLFLPELEICRGFEQNEFHVDDVFDHTIKVVEQSEPDLVLRLAALFHDIGKPPSLSVDEIDGARHFFKHESIGAEMTRAILARLKYSTQVTNAVSTMVATHMRPLDAGAGGIRRLLRDTAELFPIWRKLKEADASSCKMDPRELQSKLAAFDQLVNTVQSEPSVSPLKNLALKGSDLLALGLPEGPRIGEILRSLHERVLDNPELNHKEALIEILRAEGLLRLED